MKAVNLRKEPAMYQVIDGKLYANGEPVGVRRAVVQRVLAEWGYVGDSTPALARGAAQEMIRIERELLLAGVELALRPVYAKAA